MTDDPRVGLLYKYHADRWAAHEDLFAHRHPDASAAAHRDLVAAVNRPAARVSIEGFRGMGKTTYLEETAILKACYGEFHNMIVVGPSFALACNRTAAIANEFLVNRHLIALFGDLKGPTWQDGKLVLATGVCIQALGRDQAMTGIKHLQWRPDAFLVDDIEDPEEKRTDVDREDTWRWMLRTFLPSLADVSRTWGRFLGTRRGTGSLPERLEKAGMATVKFPIEHRDADGRRQATWPAKYPLTKIDGELKPLYAGDQDLYMQEMMCEATSSEARLFRREHIRVDPRTPSWEGVYAMIDPARTRGPRSATTGWAVWSWVRNRLVVWAAGAPRLLPDEIVALAFEIAQRFQPIWLGIEKDGLEEWLLQPLRQEQLRRGVTIPYRAVAARSATGGGGQERFVGGLQPFFAAGEVSFAQPLPELEAQLLSFPHGPRDAANALAYALTMRPGAAVYDGFGEANIVPALAPAADAPLYLAGNADGRVVSAILAQRHDGEVRLLADWLREGSAAELVGEIHAEAALLVDAGRWEEQTAYGDGAELLKLPLRRQVWTQAGLRWVVPARHADNWHNVGLLQAIRAVPQPVSAVDGGEARGRPALIDLFGQHRRGQPRVMIAPAASWTLRALAGGFARPLSRAGLLAAEPEDTPYKTLIEGLEAWLAVGAAGAADAASRQPVAYTRAGVAYASAMPERAR